jgi:hypothetical protein
MFNTFAVVEPILAPGMILPATNCECFLASNLSYKEILQFMITSTMNQADVEKCKRVRIKKMAERGINVPGDCDTLKEAVSLVHDNHDSPNSYVDQNDTPRHFNKIVLGEGAHGIVSDEVTEEGTFKMGGILQIRCAMEIVGDPTLLSWSEAVILGGIYFKEGIQGKCHLQHLTLFDSDRHGVDGESSFTMEDVHVDSCTFSGVRVIDRGVVATLTDVAVSNCGYNGILADYGAVIILISGSLHADSGPKMRVYNNCQTVGIYPPTYGLNAQMVGSEDDEDSAIFLFSPLTKEEVSLDNGGGGNFGGIFGSDDTELITTITAEQYKELYP